VLDGPDGAGKSTQHKRLTEELRQEGVEVVSCRDPGGTTIGDRIRSVLLDHDLSVMDVNCETMLFMASRAQLVSEVIKPALTAGKTVLCDRFVTSTCADQGAAGYDARRVIELARFAIDGCWPDLTIIIDVDVEQGFDRIGRKKHHAGKNRKTEANQSTMFGNAKPDAMEARPIDFHRKVREMFLGIHEYYPAPVVTVDGNAEPDAVYARITSELTRVFG
jgi:dTMP kinase